jgi:hypothetical protein
MGGGGGRCGLFICFKMETIAESLGQRRFHKVKECSEIAEQLQAAQGRIRFRDMGSFTQSYCCTIS